MNALSRLARVHELKAIREPTEAQMIAMGRLMPSCSVRDIWQAGVDALIAAAE